MARDRYALRVLALQPEPAVSLIDTDLEADTSLRPLARTCHLLHSCGCE